MLLDVFVFIRLMNEYLCFCFFFSSRRRHTRLQGDWSSDVCSSDLGPQRLAQEMGKFLAAANKDPQLAGVQTLWRAGVPQLHVDVDREKAKALGVPLNDLFDTLARSEERRVGKECRSRWSPYH